MQSKSPYEIRLELLKLSFEILVNQKATESNNRPESAIGLVNIEGITTEDVVKQAEALNVFVSKKDKD